MLTILIWMDDDGWDLLGLLEIFEKFASPSSMRFFFENTTPNSLTKGGASKNHCYRSCGTKFTGIDSNEKGSSSLGSCFGIIYSYLLPFYCFFGGQRKKKHTKFPSYPNGSKANISTPLKYKSLLCLLNFRGEALTSKVSVKLRKRMILLARRCFHWCFAISIPNPGEMIQFSQPCFKMGGEKTGWCLVMSKCINELLRWPY